MNEQSNYSQFYNMLNPQQRSAVDAIEGPVMVLAGPGTGKTQMLAMRISNILQQTDTAPHNILCLTFTETGTVAMRERLLRIIGPTAYSIKIHTFHGFASEVIQTFPEKFLFAKELRQLDDINRLKIIRAMIDGQEYQAETLLIPFHNKYYYQDEILNSIRTLKMEGVSATNFGEIVQDQLTELEANPKLNKKTGQPTNDYTSQLKYAQRNVELAQFYQDYQQALQEGGWYDYEDMIMFVIDKFKEDQEVLSYYWENYLYILVDEYQDTNGSQNEIIKLLGSHDTRPNIFVVGDDDQAIYRFQGANVENLLSFYKQFDDVAVIPVTQNYRSSQLILDAATSVIENSSSRLVNMIDNVQKDLHAALELPNYPVEIYELENADAEVRLIRDKIVQLHNQGVNYSDIAIIYRRHADAEDIINNLLKSQIPISVGTSKNVLDNPLIKQFNNLLKLIDLHDAKLDEVMLEVLFYAFLNIDRLDVYKLAYYSGKEKRSVMEMLLDDTKLNDLGLQHSDKMKQLVQNFADWKATGANTTLIQFVEELAANSGYLDHVFTGGKKQDVDLEDINAVNAFFKYIRNLNTAKPEMKLEELLSDLALASDNRITIPQQKLEISHDAVQLMTAHGSKGLEFKHVIIPKFYNGNWGGYVSRRSIKLPEEVFFKGNKNPFTEKELTNDDERRLFFVALTRARENLYVTYAKEYLATNGKKEVIASQFLSELDAKLSETKETSAYESIEMDSLRTDLLPMVNYIYQPGEDEFLRSIIKDFKLSASALNEYMECPLKFKFNRLLKIPTPKERAFVLGEAVHYALENLHRGLAEQKEISVAEFVEYFVKSLNKQLLNQTERDEILAEGTSLLRNYYAHYQGKFDPALGVEYGFFGSEIVLQRSDVEPIRLTGKLDKFVWQDQDAGTVKVVDYKTSKPATANEILGATKNSSGAIFRQLVFYKLLAELDPDFRPKPAASKYVVTQAEVDFIRPDANSKFIKRTFELQPADVESLKETIFDVMGRIRNLEFSGSDAYPLCCDCNFCNKIASHLQ